MVAARRRFASFVLIRGQPLTTTGRESRELNQATANVDALRQLSDPFLLIKSSVLPVAKTLVATRSRFASFV